MSREYRYYYFVKYILKTDMLMLTWTWTIEKNVKEYLLTKTYIEDTLL